ncbi:MAG: hypothetical protein QGG88_12200 [Gammaproteobacteria bacterium]|jgi:NitT/TauT family transport system substrate-binding protein|nr:hypothetical protein [Gammaproteobacteria bacterium]
MRSFLFLSLLLWLLPAHAAETKLKLAGPAAVVSYPLIVMAEQQRLDDLDIGLEFSDWSNPDQLRAMVLSGDIHFSAMPSNLAAIFYNKGHKLTLMNNAIWSIMWLMSADQELSSLSQLEGKEVVVPFKNDMPSIVFNELLNKQLTDANKVNIRYSHNLLDASQILLAGQADYAVLIEPIASIVEFKSKAGKGAKVYRNLEISNEWKNTFPQSSKLPQAGIIANTNINQDKALLSRVHKEYQQAAIWCQDNPGPCAAMVVKYFPKFPPKAIANAIKITNMDAVKASDAKGALEDFYQLLAASNKAKIGGKLPAADFYL